ncbi:MAG TPA: TrkA family potassium uptake protein [Methanosarcinales archaeon]|nr:TrkA family potassium uptake protein [Methanosarcinales archaeon]
MFNKLINKKGHIIILGFGDVGKQIARVLQSTKVQTKVNFIVVDKEESKLKNSGYNYVIGNATDEETLKKAGILKASTLIIVLNKDTDVIFATLVARNLNPYLIILARANTYKSIDKIYKAGANCVASLSIIAGQMLAKFAIFQKLGGEHEEDIVSLYEGIEIERYHVTTDSIIAGKTLAELKIRTKVGCTVIGIEKNGNIITDINPYLIIEANSTLAILGSRKQIAKFKEVYR